MSSKPVDLSRRRTLKVLLGAGSAVALGCDSSAGAPDGGTHADNMADATAADGGACSVTPEGEIGPYFADDSDDRFNRSNILSNLDGTNTQPGIPLTLAIFIVDGKKGCAPYAGAQVDIWHCNAAGVYSDQAAENTTAETWLRGYQLTDTYGKVAFQTIIPGWYPGRTTHIHLRVRSSYGAASSTSDGTNTTQLFFPQSFSDRLQTTVAPYDAEGTNPTTNAADHVYTAEQNGANLLVLSGDDTKGYTAAATIVLPITSNGASPVGPDGGFGGPPPDGGPPIPRG